MTGFLLKVDPRRPRHPKWMLLSDEAYRFADTLLCWGAEHGTAVIPEGALYTLAGGRRRGSYAEELGLSANQYADVLADFREKLDEREHDPAWLASKLCRFIEQAAERRAEAIGGRVVTQEEHEAQRAERKAARVGRGRR